MSTFESGDQEEVSSKDAQRLSLRALRIALLSPTRFDFQDLRSSPTVAALGDTHPVYAQLLTVFAEQDLEDYNDFRDEHPGWVEQEKLDHSRLERKIRLLTFASLAAAAKDKLIRYDAVAQALHIPEEDVELWAIDAVKARLVEGKLSQDTRTFKVHRTTYRVFAEKQWREVATKVDQWRVALKGVQEVIDHERNVAIHNRERAAQEGEEGGGQGGGRQDGFGGGGGGGGQGGGQGQRGERRGFSLNTDRDSGRGFPDRRRGGGQHQGGGQQRQPRVDNDD